MSTVGEMRSAEEEKLLPGLDDVYETRAFVSLPANTPVIVSGPGTLAQLVLMAGASTTIARIYDLENSRTALDDTRLRSIAAAVAGAIDRDRLPKRMERGILLTVDKADATVLVSFR